MIKNFNFYWLAALIKSGCSSHLTPDESAKCEDENDDTCYLCASDRCNNLIQEGYGCIKCSTANDENCLQDLTQINTIERCEINSKCFTKTVSDEHLFLFCRNNCNIYLKNGDTTERGCLNAASIAECESDPTGCYSCAINGKDACNKNEFPTNRRKCVICTPTSENDCSVTDNSKLNSKYCKNPDDVCMVFDDFTNKQISQLCYKELSDTNKNLCEEKKANCFSCGSSNCNKTPMKQCFDCTGSECERTSNANKTKSCAADDDCIAVFNERNNSFKLKMN